MFKNKPVQLFCYFLGLEVQVKLRFIHQRSQSTMLVYVQWVTFHSLQRKYLGDPNYFIGINKLYPALPSEGGKSCFTSYL